MAVFSTKLLQSSIIDSSISIETTSSNWSKVEQKILFPIPCSAVKRKFPFSELLIAFINHWYRKPMLIISPLFDNNFSICSISEDSRLSSNTSFSDNIKSEDILLSISWCFKIKSDNLISRYRCPFP